MFKNIIILLVVSMLCFGCQEEKVKDAEDVKTQTEESEYQIEVEEAPKPVGGVQAIASKIVYPLEAKQSGIQGSVFVKAFIDKEGNVVKTEIIKGVSPELDEAASKAIASTKFTPGKVNGVAVKVQVSIPIKFKLD